MHAIYQHDWINATMEFNSSPIKYSPLLNKLQYDKLQYQRSNIECNNTEIYDINNRNYAPFSNRCQIISNRSSGRIAGYFSSLFGYIHVWKAGGTSIANICKEYININGTLHNPSNIDRDIFVEQNMHKMFLFSFIRNPIQRFMSSYFESHKRMYTEKAEAHMKTLRYLDDNKLNPIQNMRKWIHNIHQKIHLFDNERKGIHSFNDKRKGRHLLNDKRFKRRRKGRHPKKQMNDGMLSIYSDPHFYPQIYFMQWKHWKPFPMDYIGDINMDLMDALFDIINVYGNYKNVTKQDIGKIHLRAKNRNEYSKGYERYLINDAMLSDDDIRMICEIYWMDYICLPINVPKQCNLTYLFEKHYAKHVLYKDCKDITYKSTALRAEI